MLNNNERLVYPHANGEHKFTKQGYTKYWSQASKFQLMNRLGEYEDLGYSPDELREMIREARK